MTTTDTTNEQGEGMVCSEDGIVVRIRSREARGEVPAYEYVVGSERTAPVAVRLRQPVPEDIAEADLGFPSACEDHWALVDGSLVAELVIDPDDQFQTVWGVRGDSHPSIDPPTVEVSPVGDDGADADQAEAADDASLDLDGPAADASSGGAGGSGGGTDGSDGDSESGEDDSGLLPPSDHGAGLAADADSGSVPAADPDDVDGSLVAQLLLELEADEVDDEDRAALADALEFAASDSTNSFVEHVQNKLERRAERLQDDVESLEGSVEQLYGVKADASEVSTLKRSLSELDDQSVSEGDLESLRDRLEEREASADADRESIREELQSLSDRAAEAERVATLADDLEALRSDAATEDDVADLREEIEDVQTAVDELRDELATIEDEFGSDLDALEAALRDDLSTLESDHESLAADHDALSESAASSDDLDQLREEHRTQINAAKSDVSALEERLESEYTPASEISADVDERLHRSLGTLVLFGIGVTGLLSTLPLALSGAGGASVTFLGGAIALAAWWYFLGTETGASLEELPWLGDALRRQ